jgi:hypothetical protein
MRRFFRFWWLCAQRAFWGNTAFANDWQWLIGYPAIAGNATPAQGPQLERHLRDVACFLSPRWQGRLFSVSTF